MPISQRNRYIKQEKFCQDARWYAHKAMKNKSSRHTGCPFMLKRGSMHTQNLFGRFRKTEQSERGHSGRLCLRQKFRSQLLATMHMITRPPLVPVGSNATRPCGPPRVYPLLVLPCVPERNACDWSCVCCQHKQEKLDSSTELNTISCLLERRGRQHPLTYAHQNTCFHGLLRTTWRLDRPLFV